MNMVDETQFINACNEMNSVIDTTSLVINGASSLVVPSDFSGAAAVTSVVNNINSSLKPKIDEYISTFTGLQYNVDALKSLEENALAYSQEINGSIVTDESGNAIGIRDSSGQIISLDSFKKYETANGTYYQWDESKSSGIINPCNIYVPKIDKLQGVLIYFSAYGGEGNLSYDANVRKFKEGKTKTTGVVIIPLEYKGVYNFSKNESISYATDAQNIAKSFGIDPKNINVFGWSQSGNYVGDLIKNNPNGTFKNAIFSSTRYGISDVTDPSVKVIAVIGANDGSNGVDIKATLEKYKSNHTNTVELYTVPTSSQYPHVGHWLVTGGAADSNIFNGVGLFEYGIANGGSGSSTVSVDYDENEYEDAEIAEEIPTTTDEESENENTTSNSGGSGSGSSTNNESSSGHSSSGSSSGSSGGSSSGSSSSGGSSSSSSNSSGSSSNTGSSSNSGNSSSGSSTPAPVTPVSILPENKYTDIIPDITSGKLESMEISIEHVMYDIVDVSDVEYNKYTNSLKNLGYTLSEDGTTWINGSNILTIKRENTNLNIYFKINEDQAKI